MASQALEDGHVVTLQKCFDSGLRYVHDLDMYKKKEKVFASASVVLWPAGGTATHSHQLPPSR